MWGACGWLPEMHHLVAAIQAAPTAPPSAADERACPFHHEVGLILD
jgi:hypothetical protein